MFSETRYAMNGDLRVAYRASREGPRDIVLVANWFTNCEVLPELPSLRGWVEAMTSLGRLILFDQPGSIERRWVLHGLLDTSIHPRSVIPAPTSAANASSSGCVGPDEQYRPTAH